MSRSAKDPCAPFRGGQRGVSRACYAAIWSARCTSQRWKEEWVGLASHAHGLTLEDVEQLVVSSQGFRCHPREQAPEICAWLSSTLDLMITSAAVAPLWVLDPSREPRGRWASDEQGDEVLALADASRVLCPEKATFLRLLFHRVPELFSNATLVRAASRRLRQGMSYLALEGMFLVNPWQTILQWRHAYPSALRVVSEAPFSRHLWRHGLSMDICTAVDFQSPTCSGGSVMSGQRMNTTLLVSFYRHRDPGLPPSLTQQLEASEDPLLRVTGMLATADRRRNLGYKYGDLLDVAFEEFRAAIQAGVSIEKTLPTHGPPTHLIWHFMDKLSLPLSVDVQVQTVKGATMEPYMQRLQMSVLPDRDVISDQIRNTKEFHCPVTFIRLVLAAAKDRPGEVVRVAEVGGFLGDCLLWAAAWLGPRRLRALEVEPVASATERLRHSLARNGLSEAVTVRTEALGDGMLHAADSKHLCNRQRPAHPNFSVQPNSLVDSSLNPKVVEEFERDSTRTVYCNHLLRALDDVLEAWQELPSGVLIDIVRVKAAGSEPMIVSGLARHLEGARVRRLHVTTLYEEALLGVMRQFPRYVRDWDATGSGRPAKTRSSIFVFKLAE